MMSVNDVSWFQWNLRVFFSLKCLRNRQKLTSLNISFFSSYRSAISCLSEFLTSDVKMATILEREGAISTSLYSYNLYRNIKLSIGEFVVQRPLHWIENGREYSPLGSLCSISCTGHSVTLAVSFSIQEYKFVAGICTSWEPDEILKEGWGG